MIKPLALTLALVLWAIPAQAQQFLHPIIGDDGKPVANHAVPAQFAGAVERLPAKVAIGNPKGDVTIAEFYDLNCPYCRRAAADLAELIRSDPQLRVVLVPFPVLGIASIQAGRVEFAVAQLAPPARFYEFHRRVFVGRGVVDGARALAAAEPLKLDRAKLIALADDDSVTDAMKSHVQLGNALGLAATPSYVVGDVAILGHPGLTAMRKIIASMRQCKKVSC